MVREDKRSVVFFSYMGRRFADSPRAIFEQMLSDRRFADWTFIWAFRDYQGDDFNEIAGRSIRVSVVTYNRLDFYVALAKSKYWVSNSHVTDGVFPPRGKTYLQTWHGTPLKKLGADIPLKNSEMPKSARNYARWYRQQASKWTHLTSQSPYFTEKLTTAFSLDTLNLSPKILEYGLPRNSSLLSRAVSGQKSGVEIRASLGIPSEARVLLYAPTFRDNQHSSVSGYTYSSLLDLEQFIHELGADWFVLVRSHYFISTTPLENKEFERVIDVSRFDDINDLFSVADVLVTDYSSSMVDFALTDKPILIYAPDKEQYENTLRGLYIPFSEFPGPVYSNQHALTNAIRRLSSLDSKWREQRSRFKKRFLPWDSVDTVTSVIDAVFSPAPDNTNIRFRRSTPRV